MYLVYVLFLLGAVKMSTTLHFESKDQFTSKCECMKSVSCKYWMSAVRNGKFSQLPVCGYDRHTLAPLLCCPSAERDWMSQTNRTKRDAQSLQGLKDIQLYCTIGSHNSSPARIANQKCAEYAKSVFQSLYEVSIGDGPFRREKFDTCLKKDDQAPHTAVPREFPHMALLGYEKDDEIWWECGGSLISERFILGVAHCHNPEHNFVPKWAKLGEFDTSTDTDPVKPQTYKITERIIHPEYKRTEFYFDVALYKLDQDVLFTLYVRPACLFTRRDPPYNKADATGWNGDPFDRSDKVLKKVQYELVSQEDCDKVYSSRQYIDPKLAQGLQRDAMICAKETGGRDSPVCTGDSGAPLQFTMKEPYCMYGLIGLTSFSKGCGAQFPVVFSRVNGYVPWIVENVWPDELL